MLIQWIKLEVFSPSGSNFPDTFEPMYIVLDNSTMRPFPLRILKLGDEPICLTATVEFRKAALWDPCFEKHPFGPLVYSSGAALGERKR